MSMTTPRGKCRAKRKNRFIRSWLLVDQRASQRGRLVTSLFTMPFSPHQKISQSLCTRPWWGKMKTRYVMTFLFIPTALLSSPLLFVSFLTLTRRISLSLYYAVYLRLGATCNQWQNAFRQIQIGTGTFNSCPFLLLHVDLTFQDVAARRLPQCCSCSKVSFSSETTLEWGRGGGEPFNESSFQQFFQCLSCDLGFPPLKGLSNPHA